MTFCGDATSVAVDSLDRVHVFNRGPVPLVVFDADGNYLHSWGTGEFDLPHGIFITADDEIWLIDSGSHFVQKRDVDGNVLMTIGVRGQGARPYSGEPFNGPTDVAVDPASGDVFVADGYGNSHIHKYSADGTHLLSWGGTGDGPGQLSNPHSLCLFGDAIVVCDRENYRLQFFDLDGRLLDQWHTFMPSAIRSRAGIPYLYLAQLPPPAKYLHVMENLGRCIQIISPAGEIVERLAGPDEFVAPHGLAIDSKGDVYVAEVSKTYMEFIGDAILAGIEPVSLRKWRCESAPATGEPR